MRVRAAVVGTLRKLLHEEDGPSVTEYSILLGLIVVVAMASISVIAQRVYALYDIINGAVSG